MSNREPPRYARLTTEELTGIPIRGPGRPPLSTDAQVPLMSTDAVGLLSTVRCQWCGTGGKKVGQQCQQIDCPGRSGRVLRVDCHRCGALLATDGRCAECRERVARRRRGGRAS